MRREIKSKDVFKHFEKVGKSVSECITIDTLTKPLVDESLSIYQYFKILFDFLELYQLDSHFILWDWVDPNYTCCRCFWLNDYDVSNAIYTHSKEIEQYWQNKYQKL